MKRFHWPLERLLSVTAQRERAQRAELLGLSRRIAQLRQEILMERVGVRALLAELSEMDCQRRISSHGPFMRWIDSRQRRIVELEGQAAALAAQRTARTRQLLKVRKTRQTLERLREEARQRHLREQLKIEQKQFDEVAHVRKAREMIASQAAEPGTA